MSGICNHRQSGRQDTDRGLKLVKILAMAKKEGMTSWLAKILGRHFHQARSRHVRPLVAKVASPALSVVCAGDSLQITCKREALHKINWYERPKACRNIAPPFSSLPDWTLLYFDLRPRFLLCQWYSPQETLWKHPFEHVWTLFVCLTHKSPSDNLHGSGYARHVDKLTFRCSFKALVGAGVFG